MVDMRMIDLALKEAEKCVEDGGGPFGAVIVSTSGKIVKAHNMRRKTGDPTAHAEVMALRKAKTDTVGATMYTSCEPCPMCASASAWAKIANIYYVISLPELNGVRSTQLRLRAHDFYKTTGLEIVCSQVKHKRTKLEARVKKLLRVVAGSG